jgi:hypothetical protein
VLLETAPASNPSGSTSTSSISSGYVSLWPTERTLRNWIKYQWKPSGEVELHLGSKGFFTTVFMNLEDRDKVFEGGGGGGGGILPRLSRAIHAVVEGKLLPRERNL